MEPSAETTSAQLRSRVATIEDAAAIAAIYNQGIASREATFETRLRSPADIEGWFDGRHPIVVVENGSSQLIAFAATSQYRPRECYSGVAEFAVYVDRQAQRRGAGRLAMQTLIAECRKSGFWKLLSRVFVENESSRGLLASIGFREVGVYEKHGQLNGAWRDVVVVEFLL
jgi:L-amino acid N-acyltransferase YncA